MLEEQPSAVARSSCSAPTGGHSPRQIPLPRTKPWSIDSQLGENRGGKSLHREASEQHIMARRGAGSPGDSRKAPPRTASQAGQTNATAQRRAMQQQTAHQTTPAGSGMHAYRISPAVRADVCACFARRTQGSECSKSSVSRVLPAVLVQCLLLWLLRCFERRCLCL